MSDRLEGAVVVVTGAATGVGRALALEAANRGARVMLSDIDDVCETQALITADGGVAEWMHCDVSDYDSVKELAAATLRVFGGVNVLINNAGVGTRGSLQDTDPAVARRAFEVNIGGVFHGIHAFAPSLSAAAAAGQPSFLLNIGSEHSLGVPPHVQALSVYTVTKYATMGLTDTARRDLEPFGVRVSMLAPGWVRTENVLTAVRSSHAAAMSIEPFAQNPDVIASAALDGMLDGIHIIATNPASRAFAMDHARAVMADVQRLPYIDDPLGHDHDGTGDAAKCPVLNF